MLTVLLLIIAGVILFFLLVMVIDCNRFVVKEYTCVSDKLQKDGDFILLSDLHNKVFGKENEALLAQIDKYDPDGILIAGDMYTAAAGEDNCKAAEFVCKLAKKYPVYYGNGNHEHKTRLYPGKFGPLYENYMKKIGEAGVKPLMNEHVYLPPYHMEVYGLEIERGYYQKFVLPKMEQTYLKETLGEPDIGRFNLLIAHNPDYFETYADWGADLVVSGHVHGGLMKLPILGGVISPRLRLFPKYDGGSFQKGSSRMILGRGLGTHTLPIRIFNPGELVVIHLRRSSVD